MKLGRLISNARLTEGEAWTAYQKGAAIFRMLKVEGTDSATVRTILLVQTAADDLSSTYTSTALGIELAGLLRNWQISDQDAEAALSLAETLWKFDLADVAYRRARAVAAADKEFSQAVSAHLQRPATREELDELIQFQSELEAKAAEQAEELRKYDSENPGVRLEQALQSFMAANPVRPVRPGTPSPEQAHDRAQLERVKQQQWEVIKAFLDAMRRRAMREHGFD